MNESKEESSKLEIEEAGTVNIQGYEIPLLSNAPATSPPLERMFMRDVKLPYVLFEKNSLTRRDGKTVAVKRYFELPLNGSHCYPERIQYYLDKGFRIIRYHVPATREERAQFKNGFARDGYTVTLNGDGQEVEDPFGVVLGFLEKITKGDEKQRKLEAENAELRKQLTSSSNKPNMKVKE